MPAGPVRIRLPRPLLQYWEGPPVVDVEGTTLAEALHAVDAHATGLSSRVLDDRGWIRQHVAVFINGLPVSGDASSIPLRGGEDVRVVPAVSGG